ncbi:cytochrome P450 [Nocardioides psychrotolerans]|uniref:Cytochrome P450 n=1 Tax=Nocardioides psychrotolerans TaxID=1005945 RepID=A0A1I3LYV1_9ACTN|nr:cytochrome P450 [Nocardioides psychrotolerans]GEP38966.1 cytochrome P450 [Nocardioides psychrotolerans]SFI89892.1 Cytochrome P450 [Nocardioides psychrotolerans]
MLRPPLAKIPLIGHTLDYMSDPLAFMRRQHALGPVTERRMMGLRWTLLSGPDACEAALRNADKAFANGPGWGFLVGPFFDRGLMLLDFAEHHRHRLLLQQAFTRPRIEGYVEQLVPAISRGLDAWVAQGATVDGGAFLAYPALKELTLDLATQIFMGGADLADDAELDALNDAFIACVQAGGALVRLDLPGTRWRRAHRGRRLLEGFLLRHLPAKRATEGNDLFSVLCHLRTDDGETFSDEDVVNHMIFLLMAAHDTSTITVTTALQHLGQHPEWQQRCREESLALPEHPSLAELETLTSLDLVIKESLRLVPPVPLLARRTVKATEVLGVPVPKGRFTAVMVHLSHHLPELWTDPERFDPDRFSDERREDKSHRYAWEPFGGGVHKCLGMAFAGAEVSLILHQVLRRFEWRIDADYVAPLDYHSLPFPADGLPIELHPYQARTPA